MGDYITVADLTQRVPFKVQLELADDKNPGEQALTDQQEIDLRAAIAADNDPAEERLLRLLNVLRGVVADGEARVNGFLIHRYDVPITGDNLDPSIKTHSLTFAAWYLYLRRQKITEGIQAMAEDAARWGNAIAKGDLTLDIKAGEIDPAQEPTHAGPQFKGGKRRFTQDSLREW